MKLDYRILWFEDNESSREHFEADLTEHLENKGFELKIEWLKKFPLSAPRNFEQYDLIVTDLNLLGSGDGTDLIAEIRRKRILTEVVLYSGYHDKFAAAVDKLGGLDRVSYYNGRNEGLQKKLKDIVDSTIRKVEGIRNMRGLVIAEAIELEGKLRQILVDLMLLESSNAAKSHLENSLREHLSNKIAFFQKKASSTAKVVVDSQTMRDEQLLTAYDCHVLACKVFKAVSNGDSSSKSHLDRLSSFSSEVIDLRNTLAHVAEKMDEAGMAFLESRRKNGKPLVLDAATCTTIRRMLRGYRTLFADISLILGIKIGS